MAEENTAQEEQKREELVKEVSELTGKDEGELRGLKVSQLTRFMSAYMEYTARTKDMTEEQKGIYDRIINGLNTNLEVDEYFRMADTLYKAEQEAANAQDTKQEEDTSLEETRVKDSPKGKVDTVSTTQTAIDNTVNEEVDAPLGDDQAYFDALLEMSRRQRRLKSRVNV